MYGRKGSEDLEKYCREVHYYRRKTGPGSQLSFLPYIIFSRRSKSLYNRLKEDNYPILFEGLHTTYLLKNKAFKNRIKAVRAHNIEHRYYYRLFKAERQAGKKLFFFCEFLKLYFAQNRLKHAQRIYSISQQETRYFSQKFGKTVLLPPFHGNESISILPGKGKYFLFHGNLGVAENIKASEFLLDYVVDKLDFPFIFAGKKPARSIKNKVKNHTRVSLISSPGEKEMKDLIQNAQATLVFSFQDTGIKLKLIESLFNGRHCLSNQLTIRGTGLESLCIQSDSHNEIILHLNEIMNKEFTEEMIEQRKSKLLYYRNSRNASLIKKDLLKWIKNMQ